MIKLLLGAAIGYVLGAKAGRDRYESIVRVSRRVAGSQTVQSTAGVLQSQANSALHTVTSNARAKVTGHRPSAQGANGHLH